MDKWFGLQVVSSVVITEARDTEKQTAVKLKCFTANSSVLKLDVYGLYVIGFFILCVHVFGPSFIHSYSLEASTDCSQAIFARLMACLR